MTANGKHPTYRQLRLAAWMRNSRHPSLPQHEAIDLTNACWTAEMLVTLAGIYAPDQRRSCLADLRALRAAGKVTKLGTNLWTTAEGFLL